MSVLDFILKESKMRSSRRHETKQKVKVKKNRNKGITWIYSMHN